MAKVGLRKITKSVRGKHGTVRRSYWVRGSTAATHLTESRINRAATTASKRVRESGYARKNGRFVKN